MNHVALVNGCFDPLTPGHVRLIYEAQCAIIGWMKRHRIYQEGDLTPRVVVAVNSDKSVRKLKGKHRPFVSAANRYFMLNQLKQVEQVFTFSTEEDLQYLIEMQAPTLLVKGSDYRGKPVTGAATVLGYGGEVVFVERDAREESASAFCARIHEVLSGVHRPG